MNLFIIQHPETKAKNWYIIGESYGGKYAPTVTKYLIDNPILGIKIMGMGLIDPLVFAGVQKTTSRNEIYGGLAIMSPLQISQYNTLQ